MIELSLTTVFIIIVLAIIFRSLVGQFTRDSTQVVSKVMTSATMGSQALVDITAANCAEVQKNSAVRLSKVLEEMDNLKIDKPAYELYRERFMK